MRIQESRSSQRRSPVATCANHARGCYSLVSDIMCHCRILKTRCGFGNDPRPAHLHFSYGNLVTLTCLGRAIELPTISSHSDQAHPRSHSPGLRAADNILVDRLSPLHPAALRLHGGPIDGDIVLGAIPHNGSLYWFALGNRNRRTKKNCDSGFITPEGQYV